MGTFRFIGLSLILSLSFLFCACQKAKKLASNPSCGSHIRGIKNGDEIATDVDETVVKLIANNNELCTGVLIGKTVVLTAAHCVFGQDIRNFFVYGASATTTVTDKALHPNAVDGAGTVTAITSVYFPAYWKSSVDLAILKLAHPLTDNPSPVSDVVPVNGDSLHIVGFGRDESNLISSNNTKRSGTAIARLVADAFGANSSTVTGGSLLSSLGPSGQGGCVGDSGGPAFKNGKVVGILSGSAYQNSAAICSTTLSNTYTSVANPVAKEWIDRMMTLFEPPTDVVDPAPPGGGNCAIL